MQRLNKNEYLYLIKNTHVRLFEYPVCYLKIKDIISFNYNAKKEFSKIDIYTSEI